MGPFVVIGFTPHSPVSYFKPVVVCSVQVAMSNPAGRGEGGVGGKVRGWAHNFFSHLITRCGEVDSSLVYERSF